MDNSLHHLHINASNITDILSYLEEQDIVLTINLNQPNQLLKYEKHSYSERTISVPYTLPPTFEFIQGGLLQRVRENTIAENNGWCVGHFGNVYSHQYGLQNYIFIERNYDGSLDVYRCRFNKNNNADNIKILGTHVGSFTEGRDLAANFLDWFYSKSKYGRRPY